MLGSISVLSPSAVESVETDWGGRVLALDEELMVATMKPSAIQCIRWQPDSTGRQTTTELLSRMPWVQKKG